MAKKRINLAYLVQNLDSSRVVAIVSMFSDNVQYRIKEPLNVLQITNEEKQLTKGTFRGRGLKVLIRRKVITTPLDNNENIVKMNKFFLLAGSTEMVPTLDELNNTDNLEDGKLSNVILASCDWF